MLEAALKHFEAHKAHWLDKLKGLSAIPSVSFDNFPPEEVERCGECVIEYMREVGLDNVQTLRIDGAFPYAYGEWLGAAGQPTILLYAHHDVQPPMREEIWESPVFEPTERNGRLYGRGCADDKSGVIVHLASIASYLKTSNGCPVNVKVIIEGEEEIGSPHLDQFLEKYSKLLSCDAVVVMDLQNYAAGTPTLTNSLRGMLAFEIECAALEQPLHSGLWGGPLPDPVMGLTRLLAGFSNDEGQVGLEGFHDELVEPSEAELESWRALEFDAEEFKRQAGLLEGCDFPPNAEAVFRKLWRESTLTIHAIQGGSKEMCGNVIQDKAWARVGIRLAPMMEPERAQAKVEQYLKENCPWGLSMKLEFESPARPWLAPTDHNLVRDLMVALEKGYDKKSVFAGCGATIPLAEPMSKALGDVPVMLVGIEDPDSKAHSENESLLISEFNKAIQAQIQFFAEIAK